MDMQDKELDRLFQQKLDDLEIQPSAQVWQGISAGLNTDKRRKTLLPLLSAAAGVILLITAGILFISKQPVKNNGRHHSTEITQASRPVKQSVAVTVEPVVPPTPAQNKIPANPVIAPVNNLAHVNKTKTKTNLTQSIKQPVATAQPPVDARTDEPLLANAPATDYPVVKTAAPDTATRIGPKSAIINNEKTQPALIAQTPAQSAPAKPVKKHRIRSLGDVFNVVIAAVDKRKDKVIEFSNTDEDDATITGVNLGFVKIKKDKDK